MIVGNAAIKKDLESSLAKRPKGATLSYDVIDVFGGGDYATEVGKITRKDSTGKIVSTGKYMAIWEKRMANGSVYAILAMTMQSDRLQQKKLPDLGAFFICER
jgi:hypothetical protein